MIFKTLIFALAGIFFSTITIFSLPFIPGILLISFWGIVIGFFTRRYFKSLFLGVLSGIFMGLLAVFIFLLGDIGSYFFSKLMIGDLLKKYSFLDNIYTLLIVFSLYIGLGGLIGGLLAKLYQKVLKK